ncbi:MAG: DUF4252 domain-containing protein [Lutibacter sp.]|uniref:DUF4252 domain-containing protein n=1 Tax=Lutibacter sp. TaxID=1925666 RepID=UPI0019D92F8A|nr:DUF4252 domain-containing protein [Lutibacter sp.]NOR28493.1 DUF4252 domain-containing protein [Lutibacter sp.]
MKKIILLIAIAIIPFTNYAQSSIFDKFEDMDDVTTVVVTKEAFKMLAKFKSGGEEGAEYFDMIKGLNSFRVFTTDNSDIADQMGNVVTKYLKSEKLTELMRVKEKDTKVKIYIRSGKDDDHVSELLMYVSGIEKYNNEIKAESVILSLTGDIDLNKISKLTEAHIPNSGIKVKKQ